ncbi:hypothetical protein L0156_04945 [bacterium]|nr:hypothetical protein [bacterium]
MENSLYQGYHNSSGATNWKKFVTALLVWVLPIIMLVVAVYEIRRVEEIARNLTTRFVGQFPTFMPELTQAIGRAHHTILVACDIPAYGIYSDHRQYIRYREQLQLRMSDGVQVQMLVYSEERVRKLATLQFNDLSIDDLKNPKHDANRNFQSFLRWSARKSDDFQNIKDLILALEQEQKNALANEFRAVDVTQCTETMPLYLWIIDDDTAVFAIPNFGEKGDKKMGRAAGCITRDGKLIAQLKSIFNTYITFCKGS